MTTLERFSKLSPGWLLELFVAGNLGFLAIDVYVAHAVNSFRSRPEWIPVLFSLVAPLALARGLWINRLRASPRGIAGSIVGYAAIVVGVAGLLFHLSNAFFELQTIKSLVYTAPFAAPLSYVGLGLLLVLNRRIDDRGAEWARWVVFLAMAGFVGNVALSLADHAQNGLFSAVEWVPVISASYASTFLLVALNTKSRSFLWACVGLQLAQIVVGIVGFTLHLRSNLSHGTAPVLDRFLFGAPIFAPLLFADLAVLAAIGLLNSLRVQRDSREPGALT